MSTLLDPKALRSRFAELRQDREKAEAKLAPLHTDLEALRGETAKKEATLVDKIRKAREPLAAIDEEMSMISGALKGKTGEPAQEPADEPANGEAQG